MPNLNQVAHIVLLASKEPILILITILGFYSKQGRVFANAFLLTCFNIILNRFLKMQFMMPLPESLHIVDYGFPSGHMLSTCIFYGYIALNANLKTTKLLLSILVLSVGFSLVYLNFHYLQDVVASLVFSIPIVLLYHQIFLLTEKKNAHPALLGLVLLIIASFIFYITPTKNIAIAKFKHGWVGLGAIAGFSFGWLQSSQHKEKKQTNIKYYCHIIHAFLCLPMLSNLKSIQIQQPNYYIFLYTTLCAYWISSCQSRTYIQKKLETTLTNMKLLFNNVQKHKKTL